MREVIEKVFGGLDRFKTKDELPEEELAKFVSINNPDAAHMPVIRQFFKAYVTDGNLRAPSNQGNSHVSRIIPKFL